MEEDDIGRPCRFYCSVQWLVSDLTDHTAGGGIVISYLNEIFSLRGLHVAISSILDLITTELSSHSHPPI